MYNYTYGAIINFKQFESSFQHPEGDLANAGRREEDFKRIVANKYGVSSSDVRIQWKKMELIKEQKQQHDVNSYNAEKERKEQIRNLNAEKKQSHAEFEKQLDNLLENQRQQIREEEKKKEEESWEDWDNKVKSASIFGGGKCELCFNPLDTEDKVFCSKCLAIGSSEITGDIKRSEIADEKSESEDLSACYCVVDEESGTYLFVQGEDFEEPENWYTAKEVCEKVGRGWRLPTKDELLIIWKQLYQEEHEDFKKDGGFRDLKGYWSSTEDSHTALASVMQFDWNGEVTCQDKTFKNRYRAVKDF